MSLRVLRPGLLSTLQDQGRHGLQHVGLCPGGAMDPVALSLANALVGNDLGEAALEITVIGPEAEQIPGSLIGSTYAQIMTERRNLRFVAINGVLPGIESFESGRYPFGQHLHMIVTRHPLPETDRFLDFLRSPEGSKAMRETGIVPCPE